MSRTDKDRPYAVKVADKTLGPYVKHDHSNGECRVGVYIWSKFSHQSHWKNCRKREVIEFACTADEPMYGCWSRTLVETARPRCRREHRRVIIHDEIPCACDDFERPPTCYYQLPRHVELSVYSHVPRAYRALVWTGPERARERSVLREAAKLANAGEISDFDFENRQHRHGAAWDYW